MAAALFRTIFAQPDADAVTEAWDQVTDSPPASPKRARSQTQPEPRSWPSPGSPRPTGEKSWSTNPLERINKEIKRRSRVVGIFPNEASAIRLVGAILADLNDEWQASERRYLSEDSMSLLYPQRDSLATAELTAGN